MYDTVSYSRVFANICFSSDRWTGEFSSPEDSSRANRISSHDSVSQNMTESFAFARLAGNDVGLPGEQRFPLYGTTGGHRRFLSRRFVGGNLRRRVARNRALGCELPPAIAPATGPALWSTGIYEDIGCGAGGMMPATHGDSEQFVGS